MKKLVFLFSLFILGCVSIPQQIDTSKEQDEARQAARDFEHFPGPGSNLTREDRQKAEDAQKALNNCASNIEKITDQANSCIASLKKKTEEYKEIKKKYDAEHSIWGGIASFFSNFFSDLKWSLIFLTVGFLLGKFWPYIWAWAKFALRFAGVNLP